ncbi:hypothetical protein WP50_15075 [Lactiplantibacillus plantarum]|nr:hypothetical protein WP50_15075 [Lactiplantibacillus plantarum]
MLVEVGKNSRQNDHLTLTARKDYYWMHAGGEHHTRKQIESLTKALDHLPDVSDLQLKGTLLKTYASQIEGHHHFVELPDYQGHQLSIKLDIKKSIIENAEDYFHRYHKSKRGQATVQQNLATAKFCLTVGKA